MFMTAWDMTFAIVFVYVIGLLLGYCGGYWHGYRACLKWLSRVLAKLPVE